MNGGHLDPSVNQDAWTDNVHTIHRLIWYITSTSTQFYENCRFQPYHTLKLKVDYMIYEMDGVKTWSHDLWNGYMNEYIFFLSFFFVI